VDAINTLKCEDYDATKWTQGLDLAVFDPPAPTTEATEGQSAKQSEQSSSSSTVEISSSENGQETQRTVVDVSNLSEEERKAKLIQAIEKFVKDEKIKEDFVYDQHKDDESLNADLRWRDIATNLMAICNINSRPRMKLSRWQSTMREMESDPFINHIKWRG
jgi:hypothetical protein